MNDTPGWASPGSAPSDGKDASVPRPAEPADDAVPPAKWSASRPPAAEWSAPSALGPAPAARRPAPGWGKPAQGGGPGRGNGWGPPPAAKPGVIPLRPLGFGEILNGAVSTLRAHWRTLLSISVPVAVIAQVADVVSRRYLVPDSAKIDPDATPSELLRQSADSIQSAFIAQTPVLLVALIGTLITTAMLTTVISRSVLGRPVSLSGTWTEARPRLPQLLGLTLLLALMNMAVIAVGILPGLLLGGVAGAALLRVGALAAGAVVLWLLVRFSLASPALMLERRGVVASMRRSAKLVRDAWWRVFGVLALTVLLVLLVVLVIGLVFTLIAFTADGDARAALISGEQPAFSWLFQIISSIGAVTAAAITYPISAGVTALLYVDQRIRREALDLELGRAAGIAGYGSDQQGHDAS
ncbi:glycerophosphoryl diester phosphodiesterase membrane domain-containing protein [Streptomyces sp. NPDC051569]|uniref:DUF7544 domain-containing protein n=1 Tax=Streptomyces sp. NPDC051569 TaxID=3365661 RepID=UPI0037941C30